MLQPLRRLGSAVAELRRRRVFQVVAFYAVAAWLAVQVTAIAVPALHLPSWTLTLVFFLALLGFPLAAVLAWAYDVTPGGIERANGYARATEDAGSPEEARLPADPTEPLNALRRLRRPDAGTPRVGQPRGMEAGDDVSARSGAAVDAPAVAAARLVLTGFIVLVMAGLGWLGWQLWLAPEPAPVHAAETGEALDPTRVAVLYFDDYSEAGDLTHFANGLTEALIHELTQVPALDVISRFGVKPFRRGEATVDSIVRVLRAGSLIEGSVQRSGEKLRVTVQLVDGATGSHLESETLERPWGELFELQDDLVAQVSDLMRKRLGTSLRLRARRATTESIDAWTLVRRAEALRDDANELWAAGEAGPAARLLDRADSLLRVARAEDDGWWEPPIQQAWTAADRARHAGEPALEAYDARWMRRGLDHADEALALKPGDAAALALRGKLRLWLSENQEADDPDELRDSAERDLRAAVAADPGLAEAWSDLSELLRRRGLLAEARLAGRRALEADAFLEDAPLVTWRLYQISVDMQDLEGANAWCEEGRRRFPEMGSFVVCSLFHLALPGGPEPDVERAWTLYRDFTARSTERSRMSDRMGGLLFVAATLARAGQPDSARAVVAAARSLELPPEMEPWRAYYEANVRLHLGERETSVTLLEQYAEALPTRRPRLASDWMFRDLWEDPRFQALTRTAEDP